MPTKVKTWVLEDCGLTSSLVDSLFPALVANPAVADVYMANNPCRSSRDVRPFSVETKANLQGLPHKKFRMLDVSYMDLDTDDILALLTQTHALKVAGLRRLRENFVSSLTGIVDFPRELHLNDCEFEADTAAALAVFLDAPDPNVHEGIMKADIDRIAFCRLRRILRRLKESQRRLRNCFICIFFHAAIYCHTGFSLKYALSLHSSNSSQNNISRE